MPAIQSSREAARKTQCKNNLKQMSVGFLNHESAQGFFPSSGWGNEWVGDPDGGFGATQPGGWAYSILPYMDYHDPVGGRQSSSPTCSACSEYPPTPTSRRENHLQRLVTTVVPLFNCPTKREAQLYPMHETHKDLAYNVPGCSSATDCRVARGDYLANSGNIEAGDMYGPPRPDVAPLVSHRRSAEVAKRRLVAAQ